MLIIGLSRNRGGVESYILNMARSFSAERMELYFPVNGAEEVYGEELKAMGHSFIDVPRARGRHFISYYRQWNRIFKQCQFDAVYMNDCSTVSLNPLVQAWAHHVPVRIFHAHSSSWVYDAPFIRRLFAAWNKRNINSLATKLLSCSKEAGEWTFPSGSKYKIIPNAIDIDKYMWSSAANHSFREELGVGDSPLIGYIGHLVPVKNPIHFVQIFAALRKEIPNAIAIMTGSGFLLQAVKEAVREQGLSDECFKLLGERNDVPRIMSALNCLVLPSLSEGFPLVLVEAQAQGLPCVVSDTVSQITNLSGLLDFVSLDDISGWVRAISKQLHRSEARVSYAQLMREIGYDRRDVFTKLMADIVESVECGQK